MEMILHQSEKQPCNVARFQNDFQCCGKTIFVLATNTPSSYINSQGSLRTE